MNLLKRILGVSALFQVVSSHFNGYDPPSDGKFFYMDLRTKLTRRGRFSTVIFIGEENDAYDLLLSTNMYQVSVMTRDCPDYLCNVPKSLDTVN